MAGRSFALQTIGLMQTQLAVEVGLAGCCRPAAQIDEQAGIAVGQQLAGIAHEFAAVAVVDQSDAPLLAAGLQDQPALLKGKLTLQALRRRGRGGIVDLEQLAAGEQRQQGGEQQCAGVDHGALLASGAQLTQRDRPAQEARAGCCVPALAALAPYNAPAPSPKSVPEFAARPGRVSLGAFSLRTGMPMSSVIEGFEPLTATEVRILGCLIEK